MVAPMPHTERQAPRLSGRVRFAARSRLFRKPLFFLEVEVWQECESRTIGQDPGEGRKWIEAYWRPLEAEDPHGRTFITALEAIEP